jgi:hypothetical protein
VLLHARQTPSLWERGVCPSSASTARKSGPLLALNTSSNSRSVLGDTGRLKELLVLKGPDTDPSPARLPRLLSTAG